MIIYQVLAKVRKDLIKEFESFIRFKHIPDLLETGYFENAGLQETSKGNYRVWYHAKTREELDSYLDSEAEDLRKDFVENFPEGVEVSREILEE